MTDIAEKRELEVEALRTSQEPIDSDPDPTGSGRSKRGLVAGLVSAGLISGGVVYVATQGGDGESVDTAPAPIESVTSEPVTTLDNPSETTITVTPESTSTTVLNAENLDYAIQLHIKDSFYTSLAGKPGHILDGVSFTAYGNSSVLENARVIVLRDIGGAKIELIWDFHGRLLEDNEQFAFAAPREGTDVLDIVIPSKINSIYATSDAALRAYSLEGDAAGLSYINESGVSQAVKSVDLAGQPNMEMLAKSMASDNPESQPLTLEELTSVLLARATA